MKVLLNDGLSRSVTLTGIGHHAVELWRVLRELIHCDITDYGFLKSMPRVGRRFAYIGIANAQVLYQNYDLIHYQNHYAPFLRGKSKKVVTVHDLVAFRFPETLPTIYRTYNQHAIKSAIKHCDAIFTRSIAIKEEILAMFPYVNESTVYVCDGGLRDIFLNETPNDKVLKKKEIMPYSYFLYVGDLLRRKNLSFLLEAFIQAKQSGAVRADTRLLLIGKQAWGSWDFKHLLRADLGITTLGYITDEDLVSFYRYSKGVIYPSIYEGYGLPLLEAMSQHVPIIMSNIPTNKEIDLLHNKQMFTFELEEMNKLVALLQHVDQNNEQIRRNLNYGSLQGYLYKEVAKRHVEIYKKIIN